MFGNLMILASGVLASSPNSVKASGCFCSGVKYSGNTARMRPASEISRNSTDTPAALLKALMIGRNEYVANIGASSVFV